MGNIFLSIKPALLMVLVQIIFAGINVMYKLAANDGMSSRVIVAYRFMFAAVIMVLLALIFEKESLKKISRKVLLQAFLCGLFGMEKLAIITNAGKAKVFGTLIGIGGAMVFTFYKGIDINIWSTNVNLLKHHHHQEVGLGPSYHGTGHFAIGAVFGLLSCISFSLWLIIQHCFDVFDGIRTRSFVCSLYCEGLESMEAWVEC
ncbi:hypothetical protein GOBAR_AA06333 [Gossypium barbadense]|uniref:WAT1-related protein n=1 Tax=Gossypium barbadense TaxID=3634 RepID=A0A2P5YFA4_GOSBA|nr:hypothetical protein GOBAR_AA06333 [Gossypium barbadense]